MTLLEKTEQTVGEARPTVGVNADDLQAGYNGVAGGHISYASTLNRGYSKWFATANSGAFNMLSTNAPLGQTTTFTLPDPGAATAKYLIDTGSNQMSAGSVILLDKGIGTESSNAVTINKQSGVITTTSLTTAQFASEIITLTNSKITTSSVVLVSVMGGTNAVQGITATATALAGSSVITLTNNNLTSLSGTVIIGFTVL